MRRSVNPVYRADIMGMHFLLYILLLTADILRQFNLSPEPAFQVTV